MRKDFSERARERETAEAIERWKEKRNAVILAHNYQRAEVQEAADFCGDSLELARKAARLDADVIVFCGVDFMAETAAMLAPDRTVLMPDAHATCPMAQMADEDDVTAAARKHGARVLTYVNSTAAVKAVSDLCCTSANAVRMLDRLEGPVLFVPDRYLGTWAAAQTRREDVILWNGFCPTHAAIRASDLRAARARHPKAFVMAHPECRPEVTADADAVLSTGGMVRAAAEEAAEEFIVATETGLIARLERENPHKRFHAANSDAVCPSMKATTLEAVLDALKEMRHAVTVDESVAAAAVKAIEAML